MEVLRLASASSVMNYFVLDLETANGNCASICQLGIVTVEDGIVVGTTSHFINPEAAFDPWNIRIHGIGPEHVRGQPTWPELFIQVAPLLTGSIVVTHGPFDRVAITRACERYGLGSASARWLDNQRVVRRTWPMFAKRGYALDNLARHFGIPLRHHDALEDAIATEKVFRRALQETGLTARAWCEEVERPRPGASAHGVERRGASAGVFAGETIVFTGRLSVSRSRAADLAARCGFDVASNISPRTTTLCVGTGAQAQGNAKHRAAERLIALGHPIQIIDENAFWRLLSGQPVVSGTAALATVGASRDQPSSPES
jgi:DNA polymerase III subunit epsilon